MKVKSDPKICGRPVRDVNGETVKHADPVDRQRAPSSRIIDVQRNVVVGQVVLKLDCSLNLELNFLQMAVATFALRYEET